MEVLQLVVLEKDYFQNQGFCLPYVLKAWSDTEDYTTYKTFQKNGDEILFWCLRSTQKNTTQVLMGFFQEKQFILLKQNCFQKTKV